MINWDNLKKHKWVVAVSGGADSFALLDMCYQHGIEIICAHVNYGKRASAYKESEGVQAYCQQRNIEFACYRVDQSEYESCGNFQAKARDIRYRFFNDVKNDFDAYGLLVAHHLDDVLETYFMQIERNSIPNYYGIKEETKIYNIFVKRILLSYTKEQLMQYCRNEEIAYFDDESNFSDDYTRNKIRHSLVEPLSYEEKCKYQKEIQLKNNELHIRQEEVQKIIKAWGSEVDKEALLKVCKSLQYFVLREWILQNTTLYEVHQKNIDELLSLIHHKNKNWKHNINDTYFLCMEYDRFMIDDTYVQEFNFLYDDVVFEKTKYFAIAEEGVTIEGITLSESDFPITIRNAQKGDKIKLRMGTKKVSRFFIDNKISHKERKIWPVVVNREGNVIFVHKIGCDIAHYSNKSTLFVLK